MPTKCLLDSIYVCFGKQSFRQIVGILLITNCDPLIADLNLYRYKSELMTKYQKDHSEYKRITLFNNNYIAFI